MSQKILGLDLGTSSIGLAIRNIDLGDNLQDQLEYFSSDIFKSGVGVNKTGEYSFAAERTEHRQSRRLRETRRRRLWATLELLIQHGLCPLSPESLEKWKTYNKSQGLKREYPIEDKAFESWIRLDFNEDGVADYSSPYQIRRELTTIQKDFSIREERLKLGRAIYHIAQRRGFKSSKGETIKEQADNKENEDIAIDMKKSETVLSKDLVSYMEEHSLHTVGEAFAQLEDSGVRVRNSIYKAVRSQYEDEIKYIFDFQKELTTDCDLFKRLVSKKKDEGTIFYKKPLRSQKGLVGKCTLEPTKTRCPISHPEFEKFRALSFLNNIRYRPNPQSEWIALNEEQRNNLYTTLFISRVKPNFEFKEIREKLEKMLFVPLNGDCEKSQRTINYKDKQNVEACPITARIIKLLGEDWENFHQEGSKQRTAHGSKTTERHTVNYDALDLWHICFSTEDPEEVEEIARLSLGWNEEKAQLLVRVWSSITQGYAMLSLKALRNINQMLERGLKYSDAVMLAKVPEIAQLTNMQVEQLIKDYEEKVKHSIDSTKRIYSITNELIANYKSSIIIYRQGYKNTDYILQESDIEDVINSIVSHVGEETWGLMDADEQTSIIEGVKQKYQEFFKTSKRDFLKIPRLEDALKDYLVKQFPEVDEKKWTKLYHPSQIAIYHVDKTQKGLRLGSPNIGAMRNPVARRTLNVLRRKINTLLDKGMITTDDTRIVIETARSLNDANMRWAIEYYQKQREAENNKIREAIAEFYPTRIISESDVDAARYLLEQTGQESNKGDSKKASRFAKDVTKYRLWLEQGGMCIYTGKIISLSHLFNNNAFDIEHTIPRSKSFDSSDKNLTVCDAYYNRSIKKNQLPTLLPNYEHDANINGVTYTAIKPRLEAWEKRVERIKNNVEFWRNQAKRAQDKGRKDDCIRQKHLWTMELDYWQSKLSRFKMTEVTEGFRNSQLVDTGIITKYATYYLKSIFNNVEVQKGSDTANYRKMLGIQSVDEKKSRDKHSHHAIDAVMLTVIPVAAKKKRMLDLFYRIEEGKKLNIDVEYLEQQLKEEIEDCNIGGDVSSIVDYIESNIIINHFTKDQTLTPARKKVRVRGKEVMVRNANGTLVNKWSTGDAIRGRLHQETYFGAIRLPIEDDQRRPITKDGNFVYDDKETITMVTRVDITSFANEKDLDKIVDSRLREMISTIVKERLTKGMTFKEAIQQDIWMLDKYGNEIHADKNGRPLLPIRHVRCKVAAGRGFMTREKSLEIRKHIYSSKKQLVNLSNRDYKQTLYAQNDSNYLYLLYEGIKRGVVDRKSRIINTFEASQIHREHPDISLEKIIREDNAYNIIIDKKTEYKLSAVIKVGTRVLLWKDSPEEIFEIRNNNEELSKRLYIVGKFNNTGSDFLYIRHHLNSTKDFDYKLVANNANCLIEHRDFEIDLLGNILLHD